MVRRSFRDGRTSPRGAHKKHKVREYEFHLRHQIIPRRDATPVQLKRLYRAIIQGLGQLECSYLNFETLTWLQDGKHIRRIESNDWSANPNGSVLFGLRTWDKGFNRDAVIESLRAYIPVQLVEDVLVCHQSWNQSGPGRLLENGGNALMNKAAASGHSFLAASELRTMVAKRARQVAASRYRELGFTIRDVSRLEWTDLLCTRGRIKICVKVKGSIGIGHRVLLTQQEVSNARDKRWRTDLVVVAGIAIKKVGDKWRARGGRIVCEMQEWRPKEAALSPVQYEYIVPRSTV